MSVSTMSVKKDMKTVALEILERLEAEGVEGVWAKFAEPPHMVVYESVVGYVAAFWRDGVRILVEMDDNFKIKKARIEYQD